MSEPFREVSKLWGDDAERFGALLQSDRKQSLEERWKHLVEKRPDLATTDFGFMPKLLEHQWAVMAVPSDGVIYTIGLSYHFGHPELLFHSPSLLRDEEFVPGFQAVLNQLGTRVRNGERLFAGQRVSVGGMEFDFHAYRDEDFSVAPCGYLGGFTELFQDTVHNEGGTMPVLWATARKATPLAKPVKSKPKPKPKKKVVKAKAKPKKTQPKKAKKAKAKAKPRK